MRQQEVFFGFTFLTNVTIVYLNMHIYQQEPLLLGQEYDSAFCPETGSRPPRNTQKLFPAMCTDPELRLRPFGLQLV